MSVCVLGMCGRWYVSMCVVLCVCVWHVVHEHLSLLHCRMLFGVGTWLVAPVCTGLHCVCIMCQGAWCAVCVHVL